MAVTDSELEQVLNDLHYLPVTKVEAAKKRAHSEGVSLYEALIQSEYLSEDDLGKVVAYRYQIPYVALNRVNIPDDLIQLLPGSLAEAAQTIPFEFENNELHIATAMPDMEDLFAMLAKKAGAKQYKVFYASEDGIRGAMNLFKRKLEDVFDDYLSSERLQQLPVAKIVDSLFEYAYDAHTSDIHIEPHQDRTAVRFRIDGILYDEVLLPKGLHDQIVTRLKVISRLRTDEHMSAQDGRLQIKVSDEDLSVRISIVPTITGEKVVMRLLAKQQRKFSLMDLGMNQPDLEKVWDGFSKPFGMILSTGPTGSGKTTTIYAILKILNTRDRNIATIEDPVEYELDGVNQIQANTKTNLTFSAGLRSLLRQDPDVLFVGEIRDEETAGIAINAAMTGHLVLSTMHTNDAVTTLPRLMDMGIEPFLVSSTVNIIVGQRLVRQICSGCKASVEFTKTPKGWQGDAHIAPMLNTLDPKLMTKHFGKKNTIRVYHGIGCTACRNTGYQGRLGIFEVLEISPQMGQLIYQKADADSLLAQAVKDGMTTLLDDGLEKVMTGQTSLSEIIRITGGKQ